MFGRRGVCVCDYGVDGCMEWTHACMYVCIHRHHDTPYIKWHNTRNKRTMILGTGRRVSSKAT